MCVNGYNGASYLPRYRVDAFINRKLLARRQLAASLGAGYYRASDDHVDRAASAWEPPTIRTVRVAPV
jgi:YaiO family outer membrane protein